MTIRNIAIPRKLALAFAVLIATFSIVSLVVFANVRTLHQVAATRDEAKLASDHADDMLNGVVEGQSAVRGYVLLGKPAFLDTYKENAAAITAAAAEFNRHAARPDQAERVRRFLAAVETWQRTKVEPTLAAFAEPATREQARELAGSKQLGAMRDSIKEIQAAQQAWVDQQDAAQRHAETMVTLALALGGAIAVALAGAMGMLLSRSIARPVVAIASVMEELAAGRHQVALPSADRRDEIGTMARAVAVFRDAAVEKARDEQERQAVFAEVGDGLARLADADLAARFSGFPPAYAKLEQDFNAAMDAMAQVMGAVTSATNGINDGAADIRAASDDLSQRTEQQAASLEETAAAMEEITSTVKETAASAAQANQTVEAARVEAEQSAEVVERAVAAMGGIERASSEIGEIIGVIDAIAFQTNLLALNAGVEAARAGDAGKGFAVVASEVRALAQRSAEAARDVKGKITAATGQVDAGVTLVNAAGDALARISARVGELSGLVRTIATAAEQQATGLQQVNTAVAEMDNVTQQNAAMVEEATAAARSLAVEADSLAQQVSRFRVGAAPRAASPVHQLQQRAAAGVRRLAGARATAVTDDWSGF
ncbi:methyl-accepting chemotaxis protein [Sphingomonas sp. BK345]|uniref:methyl-accepting chemotaxis protein n=1 Tax=Sphingomonas sp. BK345 TaxID=2586980 RepID=UPI00182AA0E5|nr:methyl-accepting chemotaxis protein [Sphingomonas sp. BK345]MBB3472221.1 methyl-accepting chemotaxis protein [Sphingomonas sp. BK345]